MGSAHGVLEQCSRHTSSLGLRKRTRSLHVHRVRDMLDVTVHSPLRMLYGRTTVAAQINIKKKKNELLPHIALLRRRKNGFKVDLVSSEVGSRGVVSLVAVALPL